MKNLTSTMVNSEQLVVSGHLRGYGLWTMVYGLLLLATSANAQPTISYPTNTNIYNQGTAITTLTPTAAGIVPNVNGQTLTVAGKNEAGYADGTGPWATAFNNPSGAVADAWGNIYIADAGNNVIRKYTVYTNTVSTFAGSGTAGSANGAGTAASFNNPTGVAIDASGNLYVADEGNNLIRMITPAGLVTTLAGSGSAGSANGTGTAASFNQPYGVAADGSGNLYVADYANNQIRKVVIATTVVSGFAGSITAGSTNGTGTAARFNHPTGVACDASGNVYIADQQNNLIRKATTAAVVTTFATGFNYPTSVSLDAPGNVYVADKNNNQIRAITPAGLVTTLSGYSVPGYADGPGGVATFDLPAGVAADSFGNVYVCDSHYCNIRKVACGAYSIYPYLPTGLSFNVSTGAISGTPTEALALTQFTVTAYSGSTSASTTLNIQVNGTPVVGATPTNNYVITQDPRIAGINNDSLLMANANNKTYLQTSIQYVDGLGRPIQTVLQKASPKGYDVVAPQAYDQYGREAYKYLPYSPETGQYGNFRPNAVSTDQAAFYSSPPTGSGVGAITDPFAQTNFDNSPLNRPVEQSAPGAAWQITGTGDHTVKMAYTINNSTSFATDSVNGRQVAMYYTTLNSNFSQTLNANGYFPAGTLTVTIAKDENWQSGRAGTVEEYKDIDGHVVLKRQYNYTAGAVQILSTYYVYDDLGRLAFVMPPLCGADSAITVSSAKLTNLCYQYQYDERGRPIAKKLPGKGWEYTVYNVMDQPVATQDSLQRANKEWIFTKYDDRQRVIINGQWTNGGVAISRASLQTTLDGITTNLWESTTTTGNGYTALAWPTANISSLTVNYYDGFAAPGMPAGFTTYPANANQSVRGMQTAGKTDVLGTGAQLWDVHYYDNWGRNIQSYAEHYLNGTSSVNNYDMVSTTYSFTNQPTTVTRKHWNTGSLIYAALTVSNKYTYDWADRKINSWETLTNANNSPDIPRLVANAAYNEIGQLQYKKLHSTDSINYAQTITYSYNERGWLLSSAAPLFAMTLYYNTVANKAYNGNIMYQYWGTPGNLTNHYTYLYDRLNRLLSGITSADNYQESGIAYDTQGNIKTLNRYQAGTEIDKLGYSYTGNQLQSVTDSTSNNSGLVSGTTNYAYDGNGNMLSAANTGNTAQNKSFSYNLLNLPNVATYIAGGSSATATYTYDATGNKLRKVDVSGATTTTTDYIGGIQYNGNGATSTISFVQTEEGKAVPLTGGAFDYYYYLGDNLGNTRVTFDTQTGSAVTQQTDDYYPFGLEINRATISPKNEYLYNKKELQEEFTEYDYGARFYDPVIGRWTSIDPLATNHYDLTPYNYVMNNPMLYGDEFGLDTGKVNPAPKGIMLKEVTVSAQKIKKPVLFAWAIDWKSAPHLKPLSHWWQKAASYLNGGRDYNHVNYDSDGNPRGVSITKMEMPFYVTGPGDLEELVFTIIDQEGETIIYSTKIGDETITFGGDISKTDDVLTIKNFDVDGNLTNKLGNANLSKIINQFGKQQGVREVIIEGAKRTTGANPGRLPAVLKFMIR